MNTVCNLITWVVALAGFAVLGGCETSSAGSDPSPSQAAATFSGSHPIQVVCTTQQVADMLHQIGGRHVAVDGLMGPGVDPHLYKATPSDNKKLKRADLIFFNGMHLEGRLADLMVSASPRCLSLRMMNGWNSSNAIFLGSPHWCSFNSGPTTITERAE